MKLAALLTLGALFFGSINALGAEAKCIVNLAGLTDKDLDEVEMKVLIGESKKTTKVVGRRLNDPNAKDKKLKVIRFKKKKKFTEVRTAISTFVIFLKFPTPELVSIPVEGKLSDVKFVAFDRSVQPPKSTSGDIKCCLENPVKPGEPANDFQCPQPAPPAT